MSADLYQPTQPTLEWLCRATIHVGAPLEIGDTAQGRRRVIPITGGTFTGERLSGDVLSGGADWQVITPDGVAWLDARYTVRTREGALIDVHNTGVRHGPPDVIAQIAQGVDVDPSLYYFRSTPRLQCGHPSYVWLNTVIAIASGMRRRDAVELAIFVVS